MKVFIRPVSFTCNKCCDYCIEEEMKRKRNLDDGVLMNEELFSKINQKRVDVTYCFIGGEPLLAPISYYELFFSKVVLGFYEIETNGVLINESWINLFKKHNVTIRLKVDFNDPSFNKVMNNYHLLKKNNINVTVVSKITKDIKAEKLMNFYLSEGIDFVSLDFVCKKGHGLTPEKFYRFLKEMFELYRIAIVSGRYIHIDYFEELIIKLTGGNGSCYKNGKCSESLVFNSDGKQYDCRYRIVDEKESEIPLSNVCLDCPYVKACFGECPMIRQYVHEGNNCGKKAFLDMYLNEIKELF